MSIEGVFSATLKWKNKRETKEKEGRIMSDKDLFFTKEKTPRFEIVQLLVLFTQ